MNESVCIEDKTQYVVRLVRRVTWVGFWVNALLMVFKIGVGWWGHSDALVADGITIIHVEPLPVSRVSDASKSAK